MTELTEALDAILAYWERVHPRRLTEILQPGATRDEIQAVETEFGHQFPEELVEFYTWSKGPPDWHGLNIIAGGGVFHWLSLRTAAITSTRFAEIIGPAEKTFIFKGLAVPRLWPIFEHNGAALWVEMEPEPGSIWEHDDIFEFKRTHDTMALYFRDLLADYPDETDFPSWENLKAVGFSFPSRDDA